MSRGGKRDGAGRPKGISQLSDARKMLLEHSPAIVEALMKKVDEGDMAAIKVAMERIVPIVKETQAPVTGENIIERINNLSKLVENGEVTPETGEKLISFFISVPDAIQSEKYRL